MIDKKMTTTLGGGARRLVSVGHRPIEHVARDPRRQSPIVKRARQATTGLPVATRIPELVVNWHVLEQCNYNCYFCYAAFDKFDYCFGVDYSKVLVELSELKGKPIHLASGTVIADSIRINFAGGEPFILDKHLREAISLAFRLGLKPSFITNGFLVRDDFIKEFGPKIGVAGFSVDSFDFGVNFAIGRLDPKGRQLTRERLSEMFRMFREVSPGTKLKINTVVLQENVDDDLSQDILSLAPDRWKLLRVIPVHGATGRGISDEQYKAFIDRHKHVAEQASLEFITEDNDEMFRSYVMLDPHACFYQRREEGSDDHITSEPVTQVGAAKALEAIRFDAKTYSSRYQVGR